MAAPLGVLMSTGASLGRAGPSGAGTGPVGNLPETQGSAVRNGSGGALEAGVPPPGWRDAARERRNCARTCEVTVVVPPPWLELDGIPGGVEEGAFGSVVGCAFETFVGCVFETFVASMELTSDTLSPA